jgi:hypothetical protein
MAYVTRKGTTVLNQQASALAIIAETYRNADEYEVYADFRVADRFDAMDGDRLLVSQSAGIPTMAHVLNLITGQQALIPWDAMAHSVRPKQAD